MKTDLVFCSLSCLVKFPALEAITAGGEGRVRILAIECVFFSFFPLPTPLAFFMIKRTHSHKQGRCKTRRKNERRQTAVERFTRFLDYRLMFDSGRSFSLKYDLFRPPYYLIIPRIVASPTSRSTSVLFPLAFWHLTLLSIIIMVGRKRESIVESNKNKLSIN